MSGVGIRTRVGSSKFSLEDQFTDDDDALTNSAIHSVCLKYTKFGNLNIGCIYNTIFTSHNYNCNYNCKFIVTYGHRNKPMTCNGHCTRNSKLKLSSKETHKKEYTTKLNLIKL